MPVVFRRLPPEEFPVEAPLLLDIRGASKFLGLSVWQIRAMIVNQELPPIRIGRKFYFKRKELIRWVELA